jgi:hypothetical protein
MGPFDGLPHSLDRDWVLAPTSVLVFWLGLSEHLCGSKADMVCCDGEALLFLQLQSGPSGKIVGFWEGPAGVLMDGSEGRQGPPGF